MKSKYKKEIFFKTCDLQIGNVKRYLTINTTDKNQD